LKIGKGVLDGSLPDAAVIAPEFQAQKLPHSVPLLVL